MLTAFLLMTLCTEEEKTDTNTKDISTKDVSTKDTKDTTTSKGTKDALVDKWKKVKLSEAWGRVSASGLDFRNIPRFNRVRACTAYDEESGVEYTYQYKETEMNMFEILLDQLCIDNPGYKDGQLEFKNSSEALEKLKEALEKIKAQGNRSSTAISDSYRTNATVVDEKKYDAMKKILEENMAKLPVSIEKVPEFLKMGIPQLPLFIPAPKLKEGDKPIFYWYEVRYKEEDTFKTRVYKTFWNKEKKRQETTVISSIPKSMYWGIGIAALIALPFMITAIYMNCSIFSSCCGEKKQKGEEKKELELREQI